MQYDFRVVRLPDERATSRRAKLTTHEQREIVCLDALQLWPRAQIAAAYGVHRSRVQRITDHHRIVDA